MRDTRTADTRKLIFYAPMESQNRSYVDGTARRHPRPEVYKRLQGSSTLFLALCVCFFFFFLRGLGASLCHQESVETAVSSDMTDLEVEVPEQESQESERSRLEEIQQEWCDESNINNESVEVVLDSPEESPKAEVPTAQQSTEAKEQGDKEKKQTPEPQVAELGEDLFSEEEDVKIKKKKREARFSIFEIASSLARVSLWWIYLLQILCWTRPWNNFAKNLRKNLGTARMTFARLVFSDFASA